MLWVDLVEVVDHEAVLLDVADRGQVGVIRVLVPVRHADLPSLVPLPYWAPGHKIQHLVTTGNNSDSDTMSIFYSDALAAFCLQ